jgi:SAM-dependent methyltransferase
MERPAAELENLRSWVEHELPRFLRTLELVPPANAGERCLEIGSMPYTFTLLLQRSHSYDLSLVDFESSGQREYHSVVRLPAFQETHEMRSLACDIEREPLPFDSGSFSGVFCCEVLEHLTTNPTAMLGEIHRVLKPNGWLIVTTPNVARLHSILALLHGRNVYDPYELVFGPTWRHNREYTPTEVGELLRVHGFDLEHLSVEDPLPPGQSLPLSQRFIRALLRARYRQPYGAQIYAMARRRAEFQPHYPPWLYHHVELFLEGRSSVPAPPRSSEP